MTIDRKKFYTALRRKSSGVFGTSLSGSQVSGVEAVLDEAAKRATPANDLAYILATDYHETGGKMQPVRENLNYSVGGLLRTFSRGRISTAEARRYGRSGAHRSNQVAIANCIYGGEWGRRNLGNTQPNDGWLFRGGGLPQLTGRRNFTEFGLQDNPDRITDLTTSVRVMFDGMERGTFTGRSLDDFIDDKDESDAEDLREFVAARKIINGTDKARKIGIHALAFEAALKEAGYAPKPSQKQPESAAHEPSEVSVPQPSPDIDSSDVTGPQIAITKDGGLTTKSPSTGRSKKKPAARATGIVAILAAIAAAFYSFACDLPLIWWLFDACS